MLCLWSSTFRNSSEKCSPASKFTSFIMYGTFKCTSAICTALPGGLSTHVYKTIPLLIFNCCQEICYPEKVSLITVSLCRETQCHEPHEQHLITKFS